MRSKRLKLLKLQNKCAALGIVPELPEGATVRELTASDNATIEKAKAKRLRKMKAKIDQALKGVS